MQAATPTPLKTFFAARFWPVWGLLAALRALSWLPLPVIYALGIACGELAYWLHARRRKIVWRNLVACFPDKNRAEIRALAHRHFHMLVTAVLATGVVWWGAKPRLERLMRIQNREIYEAARRRGARIILLSPHFVGMEFGGIYLSSMAPTVNIYQRNKNPLLEELTRRYRARFKPVRYASKKQSAPIIRPIIRLMRAGHQFYYLPDQDPGRNKSVFAPFFSVPAATFATLGRIARMSDGTVIPCAIRLLPRGRGFEIIFESPLSDYPCGDDIADATQMNRALENLIAHAPAQYFWSHRRFKTRPPGEPPFYA